MIIYLVKYAVFSSGLNLIHEILFYSVSGCFNGHVKELLQSDPEVLINLQITSLPIIFLITKIILGVYSVIQPQFLNIGVKKKAENHVEFLYSKGLECGSVNVFKVGVLENIVE